MARTALAKQTITAEGLDAAYDEGTYNRPVDLSAVATVTLVALGV